MKNRLIGTLLFVSVLSMTAASAQGQILSFSGSWATQSVPIIGGPFGGTWSFNFDSSVVTGVGGEFFDLLPLTTFAWSGVNYGGFSAANVTVLLQFQSGSVSALHIGRNPSPGGVTHLTNDFRASYGAANIGSVIYAKSNVVGIQTGQNNTGSFTSGPVIPEPTTLALFGLGLAGAGIARRRKRKA